MSKIDVMQTKITGASVNNIIKNLHTLKTQVDNLLSSVDLHNEKVNERVKIKEQQAQEAEQKQREMESKKEAEAKQKALEVEKKTAEVAKKVEQVIGEAPKQEKQSEKPETVQQPQIAEKNQNNFQNNQRTPFNRDGANIRSRTFSDNQQSSGYNNANQGGFNRTPNTYNNNQRFNNNNRPFNNNNNGQFNNQNRQFNNNGNRPFNNNQNSSQRPFNPNGPRPFNQNSNRPFNPNGPRPFNQNGNRPFNPNGPRPFNPNGVRSFANRAMKPESVESFDASIVQKNSRVFTNKKKKSESFEDKQQGINKKALLMRGFVEDESLSNEDGARRFKRHKIKEQKEVYIAPPIENAVITTENLTVKMLAEKIGKPVSEIMSKFLLLGMMVNINSNIDFDSAELIANELGIKLEKNIEKTYEEKLSDIYKEEYEEKDLVKRPPVVTVLGHVDHGKTSLLDYIRNTSVASGEAGGITQRIGAYTIEVNKETITFIDTPGHEAFSAMRKRGASLTDIAILIVAADDGVKPQTVEAIKYIKEANVPFIVAVNKIDKPEADIERVKTDLANNNILIEEWGGDAILVPISAKTGQGIDKLLEMILFVAEYQNLRANQKTKARGAVIEAELDKGKGPVATILVQNGTLKVGDNVVCGNCGGKIRAMLNEKGKNVRTAGPSYAVSVLGLSAVPSAGDEMYTVDEKMSKRVLSERKVKVQTNKIKTADVSLDALLNRIKENELKNYNIIVKADVQGSLEALTASLSELKNEEIKVNCIHGGVGIVNENDVMLASASGAIIIAFDVKTDFKAQILSEKYKVEIRNYKIIYEVLDYVNERIEKLKTPKFAEVVTGHAEIRMLFKSSKTGLIAGSYILDGKITKQEKYRLLRKGKVIANGDIISIQREKNEVKDITSGFECGILLSNNTDIQEGDTIESYKMQQIK